MEKKNNGKYSSVFIKLLILLVIALVVWNVNKHGAVIEKFEVPSFDIGFGEKKLKFPGIKLSFWIPKKNEKDMSNFITTKNAIVNPKEYSWNM